MRGFGPPDRLDISIDYFLRGHGEVTGMLLTVCLCQFSIPLPGSFFYGGPATVLSRPGLALATGEAGHECQGEKHRGRAGLATRGGTHADNSEFEVMAHRHSWQRAN